MERIWTVTARENVEFRHAALRFACDLLSSSSASSFVTCDRSARLLDSCLTSFESALSPAAEESGSAAAVDEAEAEAARERRARDSALLYAGVYLIGLAWPVIPFEKVLWSMIALITYINNCDLNSVVNIFLIDQIIRICMSCHIIHSSHTIFTSLQRAAHLSLT